MTITKSYTTKNCEIADCSPGYKTIFKGPIYYNVAVTCSNFKFQINRQNKLSQCNFGEFLNTCPADYKYCSVSVFKSKLIITFFPFHLSTLMECLANTVISTLALALALME